MLQENKLWRITIDTNPEDCNYHCIMCEEHSCYSSFKERLKARTGSSRRLMPKEWLPRIFEQAAALGIREVIPSTMGEPLLYEGIDDFYRLAQQYGMKVNLTTNGSFPRKNIDEWAEMIVPNTSDVKISINGATAQTSESIMAGSNFERQLDCIRRLVDHRNRIHKQTGHYCKITLQLTFMQNNMHELSDIVKLAASLDADRIKGHHLWTHFEELKHLSMKESCASIRQWNEYVKDALDAQENFRKPNGEKVKFENIDFLKDEAVSAVPVETECPFLQRELWISATGKISPCCAPDELRQSLGDFGNIQQQTLEDVVNGDAYRQLCQNYKNNELCEQCNMRR